MFSIMNTMTTAQQALENLNMGNAAFQANNYFENQNDLGRTMAEEMFRGNINHLASIGGHIYVEPIAPLSYDFDNPRIPYGGSMRESTEDWIIGMTTRNLERDNLDREEYALDMRRRFGGTI